MESRHVSCEPALLPGRFQLVPRQNEDAVEKPFGNRVRLRQIERNSVRVELTQHDRLAFQHEERALRGVNLLVQDRLEGKNYIVRIERVAVGELNTLPEFELPVKTVLRCFPGLRQRRLRIHRLPVDMNQVRHQALQHLARTGVAGDDPIQGLRLGSLRQNQASAGASGMAGNHQTIVRNGVETPRQRKYAWYQSRSFHRGSENHFKVFN